MFPSSWLAVIIYLNINLLFGVVGHLGVEFIPRGMANNLILRFITNSTFHAFHHYDKDFDFGFYTNIWDRLFKSISPVYNSNFGKIPPKN